MLLRPYEASRDLADVVRIWKEIGWISKSEHEPLLAPLLDHASVAVAELAEHAECMVLIDSGEVRYFDSTLPIAAVTGVTTSLVARKRGLAGRLTARLVSERAAEGDAVAFLGAFELGFYDRLGFGTGSYAHWTSFAPGDLRLPTNRVPRVPLRLVQDDWERIHTSREARIRHHGSCTIHSAPLTRFELHWSDNGFGLGYEQDGELTHHIWCSTSDADHGPYRVEWMVYRTADQLFELLALLRTLGDQIQTVRLADPPGIRMHSLLRQPFTYGRLTRRAEMPHRVLTEDYWQARILDLGVCLGAIRAPGGPVRFNLVLTDPIAQRLDGDAPWRGVAGEYVVCLGSESSLEAGRSPSLPTLHASVNALTRFWLGAVPAERLAWIDEFAGPRELLATLDREVCLPAVDPDWVF